MYHLPKKLSIENGNFLHFTLYGPLIAEFPLEKNYKKLKIPIDKRGSIYYNSRIECQSICDRRGHGAVL